mgnify:CR=1 FL=1
MILLVVLSLAHVQAASQVGQTEGAWESWSDGLKNLPVGPFRLDIGGEVRLRFEDQSHFDVRGYRPGTRDRLLLTRFMLDLNLRLEEDIRVFMQWRDAQAIDSDLDSDDFPKNNPIQDTMDIRQAFAEWLHVGGSPVGIKMGRQQISYGDQRVFGPGLYGNTGRYVWDAAMLKIDTDAFLLDLWAGRYIENRPDVWPNRNFHDPSTLVAYGTAKGLPVRLDAFYAFKYDDRGETRGEAGPGYLRSHALGLQSQGTLAEPFDYTATLVWQGGNYGDDRLEAWGANAGLGATLPLPWEPRWGAQFTWGSGDRDPNDGVHGTFDGVWGGADINFYGDLNLFYWANLRDYEVDLHLRPCNGLRLFLECHLFTLDEPRDAWYTTGLRPLRRDVTGHSGMVLGSEVNLRAVYSPFQGFECMVGYGYFSPGSFVRRTGPDEAAQGGFLQIRYTF